MSPPTRRTPGVGSRGSQMSLGDDGNEDDRSAPDWRIGDICRARGLRWIERIRAELRAVDR